MSHHQEMRGFTLVELLIVVVILAMLAAIVVPASVEVRTESEQSAFVSEMRIFLDAATIYEAKNDGYLEDSSSGAVPSGFDIHIDERGWLDGTPIGGVWDVELDSFGVKSALGVHFQSGPAKDDAYMTQIDALIDDGDLATGGFRRLAEGRYYYLLAES